MMGSRMSIRVRRRSPRKRGQARSTSLRRSQRRRMRKISIMAAINVMGRKILEIVFIYSTIGRPWRLRSQSTFKMSGRSIR